MSLVALGNTGTDNRMSAGRKLRPGTFPGLIADRFKNGETVTPAACAAFSSRIRQKKGKYRTEAPELSEVDFYMIYSWEYDTRTKLMQEVAGKCSYLFCGIL